MRFGPIRSGASFASFCTASLCVAALAGCATGTNRMSLQSQGPQTDGDSASPSLSADGRYLAYSSAASNVVAQDQDGFTRDVFLADLQAGTTVLVSAGLDAHAASGASFMPVISADGSTVAFVSYANNLVLDDLNNQPDVFAWSRATRAITRVSVASDGTPGDGPSGFAFGSFPSSLAISATGRFLAFTSWATSLVAGDSNNQPDVFVRDVEGGTTTRVSVTAAGTQATGGSYGAAMSGDGTLVAFSSVASNLVAGDTNNVSDVFVRDLAAGTTTRVSLTALGGQASAASGVGTFAYGASLAMTPDGHFLVFRSDANNLVAGDTNNQSDLFVRDLVAGSNERVNVATSGAQGNAAAYGPVISGDGRYVAFTSLASSLTTGDTNGKEDVFVRDRTMTQTVRVSVATDGSPANAASGLNPQEGVGVAMDASGARVAFVSKASNLLASDGNGTIADVFVTDWSAAAPIALASKANQDGQGNGISAAIAASADVAVIAFASLASNLVANDGNGSESDVFVRQRATRNTRLVSVADDGTPANAASGLVFSKNDLAMTPDGRHVVFASLATNLTSNETGGWTQIYVRDLEAGTTTLVSTGTGGAGGAGDSISPVISDDGRYVAFASLAADLIPSDGNGTCDVFVRDRILGVTTRASVSSSGAEAHGCSGFFTGTRDLAMSADGRYVAFASPAADLVAGDGNGRWDVFVHDRDTGATVRASVTSSGAEGHGDSLGPALSPDGRYVAFSSTATDLVSPATNGQSQVFVRDLQGATTTLESVGPAGAPGNFASFASAVSSDGAKVVFTSFADDLFVGDINSAADVFVRDRTAGTTQLVSLSSGSLSANAASGTCYPGTGAGIAVTAGGRYVVFDSESTDMVARDTNGAADVYLRDLTVVPPAPTPAG